MGVIGMKGLAGGLLTSAAPSMAYLRRFDNLVPIWGIQRESELQEVLELEKNPPALDEAMMARIGFARPDYYEESDVRPETGYKGGFEVPVAETGEDVRFVKTTARIDKPRR